MSALTLARKLERNIIVWSSDVFSKYEGLRFAKKKRFCLRCNA